MGPFACMPSRVVESVLSAESTMETKNTIDRNVRGRAAVHAPGITDLPYLAIETDGNPFPQILEARIETFCLQVQRTRDRIESGGKRAERRVSLAAS
jgi:hypothetical protein